MTENRGLEIAPGVDDEPVSPAWGGKPISKEERQEMRDAEYAKAKANSKFRWAENYLMREFPDDPEFEKFRSELWSILDCAARQIWDELGAMLGELAGSAAMLPFENPSDRMCGIRSIALKMEEGSTDSHIHRCWWIQMGQDGWRGGPDYNPAMLRHPYLFPWDDLPDAVKHRFRALGFLAHAGLKIERLREPVQPGPAGKPELS